MSPLAAEFHEAVIRAHEVLRNVPEDMACMPYPGGKWTRKEVVGHLIDSALNNHQRFVRASIDGAYVGPGYKQNEWVRIHGYGDMSWAELVLHWHTQNALLARAVERIPLSAHVAPCRVGDEPEATLEFIVRDYLQHMRDHLTDIAA